MQGQCSTVSSAFCCWRALISAVTVNSYSLIFMRPSFPFSYYFTTEVYLRIEQKNLKLFVELFQPTVNYVRLNFFQ